MSSQTEIRERSHITDEGDHDRFSHIVSRQSWIRGYIEGQEITALCGKRWVPSRDPDRYPLCGTCKELHEKLSSYLR